MVDLDLQGSVDGSLEAVGLSVCSPRGTLAVICAYMPPSSAADLSTWQPLLARSSSCASVLLCGDFNALSGLWGSFCTNAAGRLISGLVSDLDLVPLNDSLPTFLAGPGLVRNNLDLVFLSSSLFHLAACRVGDDSFGSDHLPVFCSLDTTLQYVRSCGRRFNIKNLDWPSFRDRCDDFARDLMPQLDSSADPARIFEAFLSGVSAALETSGAYRPSSLRGRRKDQPLWWNSQCDEALERRRSALREYLRHQTRSGKAEFRRVDGEVKRFLRSQKAESFRAYCESLSPSSGLGNIWRTIRSMSTRRVSGLLTDLRHDFRAWGSRLWPPLGHGGAGSAYFARVGFKSRRPWFRGIRAPRGFINLVTRLRMGHVCTGDHFARMGWNLDADCSCGEEMRSLDHLFLSCPLLSEGRPRFFGYLAS